MAGASVVLTNTSCTDIVIGALFLEITTSAHFVLVELSAQPLEKQLLLLLSYSLALT